MSKGDERAAVTALIDSVNTIAASVREDRAVVVGRMLAWPAALGAGAPPGLVEEAQSHMTEAAYMLFQEQSVLGALDCLASARSVLALAQNARRAGPG